MTPKTLFFYASLVTLNAIISQEVLLMSKPRTQEVDYFPHYCDHGKVLFILESNFQNDGYAVFYKIQELLAKTNGHCYDGSSAEGWEYLLSKMNTPEDRVISIIEKLVAMHTLDH